MPVTAVRTAVFPGHLRPSGPKVCVQTGHWYAFLPPRARTDPKTRCPGGSKLFEPWAAGKVMGLPGGRGSPIERRDRDDGQAACPIRALRPARLAAKTANPPASTRPAAR